MCASPIHEGRKNLTNQFLQIMIFCLIFVAVSLAGGLLGLAKNWSSTQLRLCISFAAGVLLGVTFIGMIPAVVEVQGANIGSLILAGFLGVYLLEKLLVLHPCEVHKEQQRLGLVAYIGFSFHSIIDGLALGSSMAIPRLGPAVFLAIVAHKLPTTFSLTSILLFRHYSKRVIVLFLSLFSLATPLGTIVAYVLLKNQGEHLVTAAITISAGTFLAIATSDLLPELHPEHAGGNGYLNLVCLLCGLGLMWFIPV